MIDMTVFVKSNEDSYPVSPHLLNSLINLKHSV
jgi:hypothetical protein